MTINVTFESIMEMEDFAAAVLNGSNAVVSSASFAPAQAQQVQQTMPFQAPPAPAPVPAPVPTTTTAYSLDDLARAAMTLMDAGRQADLQQMLSRFGVTSLPELPPAQYGSFATELRGMGAQI